MRRVESVTMDHSISIIKPTATATAKAGAHAGHDHSKHADKPMNHMGHNHAEMTMAEGMCKMNMYWNWYTIDACFLSKGWHITSAAMFAGSCVGIVFLVVLVEALRRGARELDRHIVRDWKKRALAAADGVHVNIVRVEKQTPNRPSASAPSLPPIPATDGPADEPESNPVATNTTAIAPTTITAPATTPVVSTTTTAPGTTTTTTPSCHEEKTGEKAQVTTVATPTEATPETPIAISDTAAVAGSTSTSPPTSSRTSERDFPIKPAQPTTTLHTLNPLQKPIVPSKPKTKTRGGLLSRFCPYPSRASNTPRPTILQHMLKSLIYAALIGIGYFIMLLVMYYNGYIFFSVIVGAWLGNFLFGWDTCVLDESVAATGEGRGCGC
ncbi:Copper Transporter integral membrane protein that functions in high affinity copper transport [Orbilia ellipsospora]|uniref:Copper transport protein n=1 Tax=Orbilia ellipsospora TaxID=2528407 RepID=A0AAV9X2S1_9PEZI